jgi:hypothetical protein
MESPVAPDVEKSGGDYAHLTNTSIKSFGWEGISVTVKDRQTKQPKDILSSVNGMIKAGKTSFYTIHYTYQILGQKLNPFIS